MRHQLQRDVSVVICTHTEDRWDDLREAIDSVQHQTLAPLEIVIVVDHNPQLYSRILLHLTGVAVVDNTEQRGLSGARNAGIAASHGAFVAFLDDDAVAATDWLERLRAGCEQPDVLGVGGASLPRWRAERPAWFPNEFLWVLGCAYEGLPRMMTPVRNPFGGCSCIRRDVLDAVGGYRSEVGRVGDRLISCDETEFSIRVSRRFPNGAFLYDPAAVIYHSVTPNRASWTYFRSRCYFEGRSKAIVTRLVGAGAGLASERAYTARTLPLGVARGVKDALLRGDSSGFARAGAIIAGLATTTAGYFVEMASQVRGEIAASRWITIKPEPMGTPLSVLDNTNSLPALQHATAGDQYEDLASVQPARVESSGMRKE